MNRLYKNGDDIIDPKIGDILEIESEVFIQVKEILQETEEDFVGIKKSNTLLKGSIISNVKHRKEQQGA